MNSGRLEKLGYGLDAILSVGPVTFVALAHGPDGDECVVKMAATERAIALVQNEAAALRALARAGVAGVPRLRATWPDGFAIDRLDLPPLRADGGALQRSADVRNATAHRAFERLAALHTAKGPLGAPLEFVHGDVSPDNVYVAADGSRAAVADFGLAHWQGSGAEMVGGAFRGTLLYAAPEVARGELFDGRADNFSLAASLLHLATGVPLRDRARAEAALLVDAGSRPLDASHPWRALAPRLFNLTVAEALLACLAFDARDRPRDSAAVLSVWG